MPETYEILAVKYAKHANRTRFDNFMNPDDHAGLQPMDYYVWIVRNRNRTILVDTGFDTAESQARGRAIDIEPRQALQQIGIAAEAIETVIVTHLHFDHAGTLDHFPNARFHIQEAEMAYATGACMCEPSMRRIYTADHVCSMVKKIYSGRVQFHDGEGEVAPGVTVHKTSGHSKGMQCVRVATETGYVVLASDTSHYYENFERRLPFSLTIDVEQTLRSYSLLEQLATSRAHIIPGHDPLVLERYPAWLPETQGIVHRLDVARLS